MLRNYIKIAWRNLWKNKMTTALSLFGLILGVCCFMLLGTYILNELRYDRFNVKADRIVAVNYNYKSPSDEEAQHTRYTPTAVVPIAIREFHEVEDATRIHNYDSREIEVNNKHFTEKNMILSDASLLNIFSFIFLSGNPETALRDPNSVIITQAIAAKYFEDKSALGESILINDKIWNITGVVEDNLPYSSVQFDLLGSYASSKRSKSEVWHSANDYSYVLLKKPEQLTQLQQKFNSYIKKQFEEDFKAGFTMWLDFVPLKEVHLSSSASGSLKTYLYILGAIAVLLLIIAGINFTNLMTAKSTERLREIGVRKVLGAMRKSLITQFLAEAAVVTFLAISVGTALAIMLIPSFNKITGLNISLVSWDISYFILTLVILFISTTALAGLWPALVLSRFRPVTALKNDTASLGTAAALRKFLIIFQFSVSILFIIGTLVAKEQLSFIREADTGFNRSGIVVLDASNINNDKYESFKNELLASQNIDQVSASSHSPVDMNGGYSISVNGQESGMSITAAPVDKDFINILGIKIIAGDNFNATDKKLVQTLREEREYAFMLNKTAVDALGFTPEEAVGKSVNLNGREGFIKGVLQDFNFVSLHEDIQPVVLFPEYDWYAKILIKTKAASAQDLSAIQKVWKDFYPDRAMSYSFLDTEYDTLYKAEQRTSTILSIFSAITIVVSCLGLFGLSYFMASQRKKEIGIRKVLGASIAELTYMLSIYFLKLVIVALCLAIPMAWYITKVWLQDFAYKITFPYELYVMSGLIAVGIAMLTVSFQAIKAALANPVKSLRTE
ncbi:ABC transporter permease [Leeuwenhoekiella marinoflava]|uniref:ABC transporter permease n=1 Tax=Leeuwenhoekiella marinoflava TaxID=988 RepID=UPI0030018413